MMRTLLVYRPF